MATLENQENNIQEIIVEEQSSSNNVKKGKNQLDLLLLKAESYSKFILENQERTQSLIQSQFSLQSPQKSASKKRASDNNNSATKKAKIEKASGEIIETKQETERPDLIIQPPNLIGGKLMPHQLEGLQWLLSLWENGLNGILADEMGLGKTIQIISLIAHLRHHNTAGPYLIAGPLATLSNWVKEFQKWIPECPVLLYHGDKKTRDELRKSKLPISMQKSLNFPIVITSFEIAMIDRAHLEKYVWQYIILDEGHRIKNRNCRLLRELKSLKSISRLLLTGTPIQNSLEELWSLLNFCSPAIFDDLEVFQSWFDFKNIGQDTSVDDILDVEENDRIVSKLHEILRPFVLRRLKKETLGDLILAKKEIVIYCSMSSLQQEYYARVLDGSLREMLVESGVKHANRISLLNMNMNQRKVCNHPFLFGDLVDKSGESIRDTNLEMFIKASGKFKLLDRMLPRLFREKHKIIVFSQMTKVLDLLEDYLLHKEYQYVRFDGTSKLQERQEAIDEFNDPNGNVFIFLLSTRSGGLGINLTAADTAILFDSDWNPHMDAQAQDRCHRIGQLNHVVIYRFLTTGSVEIEMMKKQLSKKKLERLAIQGGDFRKAGRREGKAVTVDDLRKLLEDDVRGIHRKGVEEQLNHEISDVELDMIMDRPRLFLSESIAVPIKEEILTTPNHKLNQKRIRNSSTKKASTAQFIEELKAEEALGDIPFEGDMYDIANIDTSGVLLSIS